MIMAMMSPKLSKLVTPKKTNKKQRQEQLDKDFKSLQRKWNNVPNFAGKYGAPRKTKMIKQAFVRDFPANRDPKQYKSVVTSVDKDMVQRRSPMDPRELAHESKEIREATIEKSLCLAPMYNKGPAQFVTQGIDVTTIGSKSRRG